MNQLPDVRIGAPADDGAAAAAFRRARGLDPFGPFVPLLNHSAILGCVEPLGRVLRYGGGLADDVREAAILATAAFWRQPVEWTIHAPEARRAGLSEATLDALAAGVAPQDASRSVELAARLVAELHRTQAVDDVTFAAAVNAFGTAGVIELTAIAGYYAMLAMFMNVAGTKVGVEVQDA